MYPTLSHELRQHTGIDNGYVVCGGVEIGGAAELPVEAWGEEGIEFEEWDGAQLRKHLRHVGPSVAHSYFLPRMAQVRNPRHLKALIAACQHMGVYFQPNCEVSGFVRKGGRVSAVETTAGPVSAGSFLVAAGAWSDRLLKQAGCQTGVRPVRGQIALLQAESPARPILLHGKRYLVPRLDGRVLVGSTEEEVGFDARPTAHAIGDLLSFAVGLVPDLADAALERCWAGLRPGTPDGLPFLGAVPGHRNLFVAAGHYRAGIQLSPATGRVMKELIRREPSLIPVDVFRLDRQAAVATPCAFRS
jgi:glycine oxidase